MQEFLTLMEYIVTPVFNSEDFVAIAEEKIKKYVELQ